ncbi:MAG: hypothetical protein K2Y56_05565 [Methylobacterium sp.]|nr:hypothetical protein [Methylobacterium sp.]
MGFALLSFGFVGIAQAQGSPRSVSECERLKNDLAYNQCLSMFGPAARNVAGGETGSTATAVTAVPPAMAAMPMAEEPSQAVRRGSRSRRGSYTRGGRQSASFAVGGESKSYRRHRRRR